MAMVVRNNLMAYNANRQLGMNTSAVSKNIEKLSSGFKINRAADDAAGLAVSEKMKAQIKGLEQASANSQDGISLVQTAEGALTEVHDMLNRMTELATKSANGTISDAVDRDAIQNEVNKLNEEIDRISSSTNFNGIKLLDGSLSTTGAAGSGPVSSFKYDGLAGDALVDVEASKGSFSSSVSIVTTDLTALSGGEKYGYTVATADGKSYTVELTFDKVNKKLVGSNGKDYGATNATAGTLTSIELGDALAAALSDTDLGKNYKISNAVTATDKGELQFEAKVAGAGVPEITGISGKSVTSAGVVSGTAMTVAASKGKDAYQNLDVTKLKFANSTMTDPNEAVFSINGKKFAVVASNLSDTDLAKLDSDVTFIKAGTASSATALVAGDADEIIASINQKLGVKVEGSATTGLIEMVDTAAPSAGTASGGLTLQIGDTGEDFNQVTVSVGDMASKGIGTKDLDVSNQEAAKAAIETIKTAINTVSTNRGELGALQNRLEHTINNLDVSAENMTSANSRVRDTDMAKQMMEYTKMNVLQQSAQAMLATANQAPQSVLQLLQ